MKNSLLHFFEVLAILGITTGLLLYTQYVLRPFDTDSCVKNIEAFHAMPENQFDVLIFGSSHGWRGVNTQYLNEKYGIKAYNYGGNWQRLSTQALYFYDALQTQKPKVVMFETFRISEIVSDQDMDGEVYYTRYLPSSPQKEKYLETAFRGNRARYATYYFPLLQMHSSWSTLQSGQFQDTYDKEYFMERYGYNQLLEEKSRSIIIPDQTNAPHAQFSYDAVTMLNEIVLTCMENDIKVIFFTVPYGYEYHYHAALKEYSNIMQCDYLDFFALLDETGIDPSVDFFDEGHLNHQGATKLADYLGQYLCMHYDF